MKWVLVTVRIDGGVKPLWQEEMDADSSLFQDFRTKMLVDLEKGCSITIRPLESSDYLFTEHTLWPVKPNAKVG